MKTKLLLILISVCFFSCTKTIDNKIVLTEYNAKIEKIKLENADYSEADFAKANKLLDKLVFGGMMKGTVDTEKTYRQLLNEAKANNEKEANEIKAYNDEMNKLKAIMSVSVKQAQYFEEYSSVLHDFYKTFIVEAEFTNTSQKNITCIEGKILVVNNAGNVIKECNVKLAQSNLLEKGQRQKDSREYPVIEEFDNVMELKAASADKFSYKWVPELLIFDDGSRMTAPIKPFILVD